MTSINSHAPLPMPKRSLHRRFRPQTRQRLIEQFENGEQSITEFCQERDLCRSSMWRWLAQRRREQMGAGALVEISGHTLRAPVAASTATATGTGMVKMQLITGARLEIPAGTDPTWLAALVKALSAAGV